jgi:hemerythrin-like domain-containing protein
MFPARAFASPIARAAFRPQVARISLNSRAFSVSQIVRTSTVSEAITTDHRELEKYYNEVINSKDIDHQTRYGNQFTWELARHSVAEELIVYPAMEKYMGEEGKAHAEKDRKHHHKVSQTPYVGVLTCADPD